MAGVSVWVSWQMEQHGAEHEDIIYIVVYNRMYMLTIVVLDYSIRCLEFKYILYTCSIHNS